MKHWLRLSSSGVGTLFLLVEIKDRKGWDYIAGIISKGIPGALMDWEMQPLNISEQNLITSKCKIEVVLVFQLCQK